MPWGWPGNRAQFNPPSEPGVPFVPFGSSGEAGGVASRRSASAYTRSAARSNRRSHRLDKLADGCVRKPKLGVSRLGGPHQHARIGRSEQPQHANDLGRWRRIVEVEHPPRGHATRGQQFPGALALGAPRVAPDDHAFAAYGHYRTERLPVRVREDRMALRAAWHRSIGMALYRGWASGPGARCPAVQSLP